MFLEFRTGIQQKRRGNFMRNRVALILAVIFLLTFSFGCGSQGQKTQIEENQIVLAVDTLQSDEGLFVFPRTTWGMTPEETAQALGLSLERFAEDDLTIAPKDAQRAYFVSNPSEVEVDVFQTNLKGELFLEYEYGKLKNISIQFEDGITGTLADSFGKELGAFGEPEEKQTSLGGVTITTYNWETNNTKLTLMYSEEAGKAKYISLNLMAISL